MGDFGTIRDGINEMFSLIPENKRSMVPFHSISSCLNRLETEFGNMVQENEDLKMQIKTMNDDARFQDKFLTVYNADDKDFNDITLSDSDMEDSISLLEGRIRKQNDSIANMIHSCIQEEQEAIEREKLENQKLKIIEKFEKLFEDDDDSALNAEMQNAQLRERIEKIKFEFNKYKDVFMLLEQRYGYKFSSDPKNFVNKLINNDVNDQNLYYFVRELSAIFGFKDELKENSINAHHPFYSGSYCTRLVKHIKGLIAAQEITERLKGLNEKYQIVLKKYKKVRSENAMTRNILTKTSVLTQDEIKGPLQTAVSKCITKVVGKCYEKSSDIVKKTLTFVDNKLEEFTTKIGSQNANITQTNLKYALIFFDQNNKNAKSNEAAATGAQQLFDAVFPAHMGISPFSSTDSICSGVKQINEVIDKMYTDINVKPPSSQCILTRITSLRRAMKNAQSASLSSSFI